MIWTTPGPSTRSPTTSTPAKGDSDPAQWLPPLASARCAYATHWVAIKYRWRLSIDPTEKTKLASILSGTCGAKTLAIPPRAR